MSNMVQQEVKPKLARFNLNCQGLPSWVYYLTWVLELFQVIVIFGPTEAFHVPFFGQSKTTAYAELLRGNVRYVFWQLLQGFVDREKGKGGRPRLVIWWILLIGVSRFRAIDVHFPGHPLDDFVVGDSPETALSEPHR